jgi:hypothetical protein
MTKHTRIQAGLWGAILTLLVGCGGVTFTGTDDAGGGGGHDAQPSRDSGTPDVAPPPPDSSSRDTGVPHDTGVPLPDASPPPPSGCPDVGAAGAPCATPGLACEYGADPMLSCDTVLTCTNGSWVVTQHGPSTPCSDTTAPSCPATYAGVPHGKSCDPQVECDYPEARCTCDLQCFDLCAAPVDGGPNLKTWNCDVPGPPSACPVPRPRLGSACSNPAENCDYGACEGNIAIQCNAGVWTNAPTACPG